MDPPRGVEPTPILVRSQDAGSAGGELFGSNDEI